MKIAALCLALASLVASSGLAQAQTMSYADAGALIAKSCSKDIERYCSRVNIGGTGMKDCLGKEEARLNPQCVSDYQMASSPLTSAPAPRRRSRMCELDARRYCRGVKPGDGNYLTCLNGSPRRQRQLQAGLDDAGWN